MAQLVRSLCSLEFINFRSKAIADESPTEATMENSSEIDLPERIVCQPFFCLRDQSVNFIPVDFGRERPQTNQIVEFPASKAVR